MTDLFLTVGAVATQGYCLYWLIRNLKNPRWAAFNSFMVGFFGALVASEVLFFVSALVHPTKGSTWAAFAMWIMGFPLVVAFTAVGAIVAIIFRLPRKNVFRTVFGIALYVVLISAFWMFKHK